jgi:HSP20 family protein
MKFNQFNNRVTTPFGDFQLDVDNLFDQVFGERTKTCKPADWTPRVAVNETETSYDLVMELPGVDPSEVSIEAKDNQLEISGSRSAVELEEGVKSLRNERLHGSFSRKFEFKQPVNNDAISAEFKHGLLNVSLPKSETVLPKKIEIKVAD